MTHDISVPVPGSQPITYGTVFPKIASAMSEQVFGLFRAVDFAISRFSQTLPYARNTGAMGELPPLMGAAAPVNAQLVFVHTLALTATMRLHYLAAKDEPISYSKRLNAAEATVVVANELMGSNVDYAEFDMLLGVRSLSFAFEQLFFWTVFPTGF